ncbi:MAG: GGDEF domain-containing protein [Lachnospiraceae bacterium]|nr:GGDEF domain-containing protein [Lachnospiraceae bacterium]
MQKNYDKKYNYIYIVILVFSLTILGGIFFYDLKTSSAPAATSNAHTWSDYTILDMQEGIVLTGTIWDYADAHNVIGFFSTHLNFEIYADNILIYKYPTVQHNPFSETSGYAWHFVEIPSLTHTLELEITSPYGDIEEKLPTFYIGNTASILTHVLKDNLPVFILCIMLFCFGIIMITYWFIIRRRVAISSSILYLGVCAALMSLWTLSQNRFTVLVMNNNLITVYASFHLFMLLPLPYILFVKSYYEDTRHKIWDIMCIIILTQNILCLVLQYTGIIDFMQTLWTSFAVIIFCIISVLTYSFHLYRKSYNKQKILFHMISLMLFFIFCGIDIAVYYLSGWSSSILGRIGIAIYIIILGYDTIRDSAKLMKMGEQAAVYHQLAFSDNMTGLGNRTAYNHDFSHYSIAPEGVAIIDFDLNGLKQVNDQHGHQAGDHYIMLAADMIAKNFNKLGKTYRVGGDEFVVIVADCESISFEPYFDALHNDMAKYNKRTSQFPIHIAYGMAIYSATMDRSLEDTYGRADKAMYQNKKRIKEKAALN